VALLIYDAVHKTRDTLTDYLHSGTVPTQVNKLGSQNSVCTAVLPTTLLWKLTKSKNLHLRDAFLVCLSKTGVNLLGRDSW